MYSDLKVCDYGILIQLLLQLLCFWGGGGARGSVVG
jgi:hypothetical protein